MWGREWGRVSEGRAGDRQGEKMRGREGKRDRIEERHIQGGYSLRTNARTQVGSKGGGGLKAGSRKADRSHEGHFSGRPPQAEEVVRVDAELGAGDGQRGRPGVTRWARGRGEKSETGVFRAGRMRNLKKSRRICLPAPPPPGIETYAPNHLHAPPPPCPFWPRFVHCALCPHGPLKGQEERRARRHLPPTAMMKRAAVSVRWMGTRSLPLNSVTRTSWGPRKEPSALMYLASVGV